MVGSIRASREFSPLLAYTALAGVEAFPVVAREGRGDGGRMVFGVGAADAFGTDDLGEFWGDFVEFIGGAEGAVRSVGDDPEASGPGYDCAGAALAFLVEHGEARVNPGDGSWRWLGVGKRERKEEGEQEKGGLHE